MLSLKDAGIVPFFIAIIPLLNGDFRFPPYTFTPYDCGTFAVVLQYAETHHFDIFITLFAILRIRSWITRVPDPTITYRAQVLYATSRNAGIQIVYIFVIKNISIVMQVCQ